MAFLGWNLLQNLAAAGLDISYGFLGEPAGYDINQRLIEYDSQSTHLRASIVGVLNTLLVAVLGCITATVFGVLAGVLRLSNNWLVAKTMAVYVEVFRNIPVLIWILIINAIFLSVLPQPRAFRGENPEASMLFDSFAFTGRGIYMPKPVLYDGGWIVIVAFILSLIAVLFYRRYARKTLFDHGVILPVLWPSLAILFVPTLAMFFLLGSVYCRKRKSGHSSGVKRSKRSSRLAWFVEPDQKLIVGDCRGVYGCYWYFGRYYVEPDGAGH